MLVLFFPLSERSGNTLPVSDDPLSFEAQLPTGRELWEERKFSLSADQLGVVILLNLLKAGQQIKFVLEKHLPPKDQ